MRWTEQDFVRAKAMLAEGRSAFAVGRELDIPRGTIQRWNHRETPPETTTYGSVDITWEVPDEPLYVYLLGIYLGDGHLTHRPPNGWTLRIYCDETISRSRAKSSRQ